MQVKRIVWTASPWPAQRMTAWSPTNKSWPFKTHFVSFIYQADNSRHGQEGYSLTGRKSKNLITDNFTTVSYFSNIKVILISLTVTEYEFISQFSRHVTKAKGEATPRLIWKLSTLEYVNKLSLYNLNNVQFNTLLTSN